MKNKNKIFILALFLTFLHTITQDSTQLRLSDLTSNLDEPSSDYMGGDYMGGNVTPPMTPKSMQKHLIKKYQEKQVKYQALRL